MSPTLVLIRADVRALRNRTRRFVSGGGWVAVGIVLGALLALVMLLLGWTIGSADRANPTGAAALVVSGFAVFILVLTAGIAIAKLFTDRSLLLLAATPAPRGAILLSRLALLVSANSLLGFCCLCALFGLGLGAGAPGAYFLLAVPLVPALVTSMSALQVLLFCLVLQVVPARRARDAAILVSALAVSLLYGTQLLLSTSASSHPVSYTTPPVRPVPPAFVLRVPPSAAVGVGAPAQTPPPQCIPSTIRYGLNGWSCTEYPGGALPLPASVMPAGPVLSGTLAYLPTAWAGRSLGSMAGGNGPDALLWAGATLGLAALLVAASMTSYRLVFVNGVTVFTEASRRRVRARRALVQRGEHRASPVAAIARKDWRTWRRDVRILAALAPMAVMAVMYPAVFGHLLQQSTGGFWWGAAPVFMTPFFLGGQVGGIALGNEARAVHLLRLAPIRMSTVVRGKLVAAALPSVIVASAVAAGYGVLRRGTAADVTVLALLAGWTAVGFAACGLSAACCAPRFRAISMGRRTMGWEAALVLLLMDVLFALPAAGAAVLAALALRGGSAAPALGVTSSALLALSAAVAGGALAVGTGRLERWQPPDGEPF